MKQSFEGGEGSGQEDTQSKRIPDKAKSQCHYRMMSTSSEEQYRGKFLHKEWQSDGVSSAWETWDEENTFGNKSG